jgi:hypothetical protein
MTTTPTRADLAAEVEQLRAELEVLRTVLTTEVRTRRLVVVDKYGDHSDDRRRPLHPGLAAAGLVSD